MEQGTILSDAMLRQLIAAGQVDILVGLPTLDNAATVRQVVRAVQVVFAREFIRERTVLVNSDGGSTDGTPDLVRSALASESETLLASHPLRTTHRISAPYHGLPGKRSALRTIFAAAELTQARVVAVLDPLEPAIAPEHVADLILPVLREDVEVLTPCHSRHPRDGVLVTQLVRPFVRAVYGAAIEEPLAPEFACSGRFASYCLAQDVWTREVAQDGIDLWLRTTAIADGFRVGQVRRPAPGAAPAGPRATLREAVQQVTLALFDCLAAHETFWMGRRGVERLSAWGADSGPPPHAPTWDASPLAEQARDGIRELRQLLEPLLDPQTLTVLAASAGAPSIEVPDEVWVAAVYEVVAASHRRPMKLEHLAQAFVPLYLARAASFLTQTADEPAEATAARLDALAYAFERDKPHLVERWAGRQ